MPLILLAEIRSPYGFRERFGISLATTKFTAAQHPRYSSKMKFARFWNWHFKVCGPVLPRCMECRRGLAMRILYVCPSVCQTHALWQNGRKICLDFYTVRKII